MKMAKWIIAVFVLSLTACGDQSAPANTPPANQNPQPTDSNHGYGYHYTGSSPNGLRIRQYSGKDFLGYFATDWDELIACTGMSGRAPLIILVDYDNPDLNDPAEFSRAFIDTNTILVGKSTQEILKDAMLHLLLKSNGFDDARNINHEYHGQYSHCLRL